MNSSSGSGSRHRVRPLPAGRSPRCVAVDPVRRPSLATQISRPRMTTSRPRSRTSVAQNERQRTRVVRLLRRRTLAMQQQFEFLHSEFIAVHDVATNSSRKLLAGIAAGQPSAPCRSSSSARQGYGTALLATLGVSSSLPTHPTATCCACIRPRPMRPNTAARHGLARVLLGYQPPGRGDGRRPARPFRSQARSKPVSGRDDQRPPGRNREMLLAARSPRAARSRRPGRRNWRAATGA